MPPIGQPVERNKTVGSKLRKFFVIAIPSVWVGVSCAKKVTGFHFLEQRTFPPRAFRVYLGA
jgi:hypothetical protein